MPELPEVETTVRGLRPHILNRQIEQVTFHRMDLRFPLKEKWQDDLHGRIVTDIYRRAKFLIFQTDNDICFTWHLGMSGSLRIVSPEVTRKTHDHISVDIHDSDKQLRYHDPRRFGWLTVFTNIKSLTDALTHYGIEPLSAAFNGAMLYAQTRKIKRPIKIVIMEQRFVVGVGNIYACEALFRAGIHPLTPANCLSLARCDQLVSEIKAVLTDAILAGGTTLKDFIKPDAKPGYFAQTLNVYGRAGQPCLTCETTILSSKIGGRNTFYCERCQTKS